MRFSNAFFFHPKILGGEAVIRMWTCGIDFRSFHLFDHSHSDAIISCSNQGSAHPWKCGMSSLIVQPMSWAPSPSILVNHFCFICACIFCVYVIFMSEFRGQLSELSSGFPWGSWNSNLRSLDSEQVPWHADTPSYRLWKSFCLMGHLRVQHWKAQRPVLLFFWCEETPMTKAAYFKSV